MSQAEWTVLEVAVADQLAEFALEFAEDGWREVGAIVLGDKQKLVGIESMSTARDSQTEIEWDESALADPLGSANRAAVFRSRMVGTALEPDLLLSHLPRLTFDCSTSSFDLEPPPAASDPGVTLVPRLYVETGHLSLDKTCISGIAQPGFLQELHECLLGSAVCDLLHTSWEDVVPSLEEQRRKRFRYSRMFRFFDGIAKLMWLPGYPETDSQIGISGLSSEGIELVRAAASLHLWGSSYLASFDEIRAGSRGVSWEGYWSPT